MGNGIDDFLVRHFDGELRGCRRLLFSFPRLCSHCACNRSAIHTGNDAVLRLCSAFTQRLPGPGRRRICQIISQHGMGLGNFNKRVDCCPYLGICGAQQKTDQAKEVRRRTFEAELT